MLFDPARLLPYKKPLLFTAVCFQSAIRSTGYPTTRMRIILQLYIHDDTYWSISSLSEALRHDRSTIREHIRALPAHHVAKNDQGYTLTEAGRADAAARFRIYVKHIDPRLRKVLRFMYSRGKGQPIIRICEHSSLWYNMALDTGLSMSRLMILMILYVWDFRGWIPKSELPQMSRYSTSAIKIELKQMEDLGLIEAKGRAVRLTAKGQKAARGIVASGIRLQEVNILKELLIIATRVKIPQADR